MIGPNGAGKTTLLRALAGLVRGDGRRRASPASRGPGRRGWCGTGTSGFVFQDQSLFPHLTALDNVAFGLRSRGASPGRGGGDGERVAGPLRRRRPGRRAGPGSSPAARPSGSRSPARWRPPPPCCCSTSPSPGSTSASRPRCGSSLRAHLASYAGIALLVTHDALDALTLADTVLVLDEGRVAQTGPPQEVAARPRTEHVARLVGLNVIREPESFRSFSPSAVTVSLDPARRLGPAPLARHGAERGPARGRGAPPGRRGAAADRGRDPGGDRGARPGPRAGASGCR